MSVEPTGLASFSRRYRNHRNEGRRRARHSRQRVLRLLALTQPDPVVRLIGVDPVCERQAGNRYPRRKGRINQAILFNRIKTPLPVVKNFDDAKLP
jgi:hypothetical protein